MHCHAWRATWIARLEARGYSPSISDTQISRMPCHEAAASPGLRVRRDTRAHATSSYTSSHCEPVHRDPEPPHAGTSISSVLIGTHHSACPGRCPHAGSSTSVQSSLSSGSGSVCANSAAPLTIVADLGVDRLQLVLARPACPPAGARRTCSIGSCSSRIFCTSSRVRYLAGSDMEWPR